MFEKYVNVEMTKQEIFDTVKNHLLTQSKKAVNDNGDCLYRTPSGLKCAAGCLIKDEYYDPSIEGIGIHGIASHKDKEIPLDESEDEKEERRNILALTVVLANSIGRTSLYENVGFISDLQDIHDNNDSEDWERKLNVIKERYHLK